MEKEEKNIKYLKVKDKAGNEFLCPVTSLLHTVIREGGAGEFINRLHNCIGQYK